MKRFFVSDLYPSRITIIITAALLWVGGVYPAQGGPPEPLLPTPTPTVQPATSDLAFEPDMQLSLSSPTMSDTPQVTPPLTNEPVQLMATVGHWTGSTSQARPMSFDVLSGGNRWDNFKVQVSFNNCNVLLNYTLVGPGSINNNQFGGVSRNGEFSFSGRFHSPQTASGTFNLSGIFIPGCGSRSQSGTWTASINTGSNLQAPSNLTALALSQMQILLNWQDNSSSEAGFKIEQATSIVGPWFHIATTSANVTSHAPAGLLCSTTYYYRVRAHSGSNHSDYSNTANATTLTCSGTIRVYLPFLLKAPLPPPDGQWIGTTSRNQPMSFNLTNRGKTLKSFKLKTVYAIGNCSGTLEVTVGGDKPVVNNRFSHNGGTFSFSGQLTSLTTATGTYNFVSNPIGCGLLTQSGTWSAQLP